MSQQPTDPLLDAMRKRDDERAREFRTRVLWAAGGAVVIVVAINLFMFAMNKLANP